MQRAEFIITDDRVSVKVWLTGEPKPFEREETLKKHKTQIRALLEAVDYIEMIEQDYGAIPYVISDQRTPKLLPPAQSQALTA